MSSARRGAARSCCPRDVGSRLRGRPRHSGGRCFLCAACPSRNEQQCVDAVLMGEKFLRDPSQRRSEPAQLFVGELESATSILLHLESVRWIPCLASSEAEADRELEDQLDLPQGVLRRERAVPLDPIAVGPPDLPVRDGSHHAVAQLLADQPVGLAVLRNRGWFRFAAAITSEELLLERRESLAFNLRREGVSAIS